VTVTFAPANAALTWRRTTGVAVAVLLGGAAAMTWTRVRSGRDRVWTQGHLRIVPAVALEPVTEVLESRSDTAAPTHAVRLVPHPDVGIYVIKER